MGAMLLLLLLLASGSAAQWGAQQPGAGAYDKAQLEAYTEALSRPQALSAFEHFGQMRAWQFNLTQAQVANGMAYVGYNFGLRRFLGKLQRGERVKVLCLLLRGGAAGRGGGRRGAAFFFTLCQQHTTTKQTTRSAPSAAASAGATASRRARRTGSLS